jgi:hypothetical protein
MDMNMILIYSIVIGVEVILLIGIILSIKKHINKHKANDSNNFNDSYDHRTDNFNV